MKKFETIEKEIIVPFDFEYFKEELKSFDIYNWDLDNEEDLENFLEIHDYITQEDIDEHKSEIQEIIRDYYEKERYENLHEAVEVFLRNCEFYDDSRYTLEEIIETIKEYDEYYL